MIDRILDRFEMKECKGSKVPMEKNFTVDRNEATNEKIPYRELVGSLMYISLGSRPDITFTVSYLSQFLDKPTESLWKAGKKVIRYLKETRSFGLVYNKKENLGINAHSDSDWASDTLTRKSMSGCVIFHHGNPIHWFSRKQNCVALSSTESEYIAAALSAQELVYLKGLLDEFGEKIVPELYIDNQGALNLTKSYENCKRSKHIDIKFHYIKDLVHKEIIIVKYVPTDKNLADMLTKALSTDKIVKLRNLSHIE
jgi:hypothetical protein